MLCQKKYKNARFISYAMYIVRYNKKRSNGEKKKKTETSFFGKM